jgi:GTP-binding protein HflX
LPINQDAFSLKKKSELKKEKERAILVGVRLPSTSAEESEDSLEELAFLADTAGAVVIDKVIQSRKSLNPASYIGKGKVSELKEMSLEKNVNLLIFDDDLRSRQVRNLEEEAQIRVVDRTELILDIFALRARTREAKIQVELAQMEYTMSRLKRMWTHFSKIEGGIGMRGPGETQLEEDKRLIKKKISNLKKSLKSIEMSRHTRRKGRAGFFNVSLIGYTNAGKSTILNKLTGADVLCENRLFATLDTTIRRLYLKDDITVLLSDTVGFIKKLPSHLVASFKSTLEELKESDLLLHVIDTGHKNFESHILSVSDTLKELEIENKLLLYVFNKIDNLAVNGLVENLRAQYENSVFISALSGEGLQSLKDRIFQYYSQKNF